MGRFNKRLAAAKAEKKSKGVSDSAVLKTLSKSDVKKESLANMQVSLEKPTMKSITKLNSLSSKVTKKDKMKIRKDHLQNKLKAIQMVKNEEKAAIKRQRKAIVGDLKPFTDTLDKILGETDPNQKNTKKKLLPKEKPVKQKKVKEKMLKDLSIFQQVLEHPQYNENPFNTISTHIENKMLLEAMDD